MNKCSRLYLSVIGMWLSLTCYVDFIAVPTVFRNVSSREEAGAIGNIIFTSVNRFEFICAIILFICAYVFRHRLKFVKTLLITHVLLILLVIAYNVHMTPQVAENALIMRTSEETSTDYLAAEKQHEFYHSLYKKTDSVKILTLLFLLGISIKRKEENCA